MTRRARPWSVGLLAAISVLAFGVAYGSGALAGAPHGGSSPVGGLDVLPFPGTPDAAPGTNIDFPAVSPAQLVSVTAIGSRSGPHAGRLRAQPAGQGTAFAPYQPFVPGEQVSISARVSSEAAAASGAPGAKQLRFSFSIARPANALAAASRGSPPDLGSATARPASGPLTHSFVSEPRVHTPNVTISGRAPDAGAGYIFLDAQNSGFPGAYFINTKGDLLWFHPHVFHGPSVFNVRVQSYRNRPVLTYWQGRVVPPGVGEGEDLILNEHYQKIHVVTAGGGYERRGTDLHEFALGHEGKEPTAFVTICVPVRANLTSIGGPANGSVFDWIIQEIDIDTNRVIWEWHALGHVPISDTYAAYVPGQTFDYFHLNSIQQLSNGHIIISARHTFAVYAIDRRSGRILWTVGGKHSSFALGPGAGFLWQHHATLHNNGLLTVFDDNAPGAMGQSRGLELHVGLATHQVTLVHEYFYKPHPVLALNQGSAEILADHNVFVGWGSAPHFAEYTPGGTQLFAGSFHSPVQSYRAYRFSNWVGAPLYPPSVAVRRAKTRRHAFVYASWNGATRVAMWRVLVSARKVGPFRMVRARVAWASFETKIYVSAARGLYFEVQALDARGNVLPHGTSAAAKLS